MIFILSKLYRTIRWILGNSLGRHDYEPVIKIGHSSLKLFSNISPYFFKFKIPSGINTKLYHLNFPSPLMLSSFEGDPEMVQKWADFGLGGVMLKTLMFEKRLGNPRPRMLKINTPEGEGLINAMGLPGKGWDDFLAHLDLYKNIPPEKPIGISIGGTCPEDYLKAFIKVSQSLSQHPLWKNRPYFFEINISCPNTSDGQDMIKHPELLDHLLTQIRKNNTTDIISIKLSPDQPDEALLHFAKIIQNYPLMVLALGNTQYKKHPGISIGGGGTSGPALFKRTLEMVTLLAPYKLPIIAIGGISTTTQVQTLIQTGATLCGMATSLVQDPYCVPRINQQLNQTK